MPTKAEFAARVAELEETVEDLKTEVDELEIENAELRHPTASKFVPTLVQVFNAADRGEPIELPLDVRVALRRAGYYVAPVGPSRVGP